MLDRNILRAGFFRAALYCECSPSQGLAKIKASKCKYKCIQIRLKSTRIKYNQLNGLPIHTLYWSSWHWRLLHLLGLLVQGPAGGGGDLVLCPAGDAHQVPDDRPALPPQLAITAFAVKESSSFFLRVAKLEGRQSGTGSWSGSSAAWSIRSSG